VIEQETYNVWPFAKLIINLPKRAIWKDFKELVDKKKHEILENCTKKQELKLFRDMNKFSYNYRMYSIFKKSDLDMDGKLSFSEKKNFISNVMHASNVSAQKIESFTKFGDFSSWAPGLDFISDRWKSWDEC
jgi:hypothetical protein